MVNLHRGEVALKVGDRTYRLKLTMNAAAATEERVGKSMFEIMRSADSLSFKAIRTVLWTLLQKFHADEFKTEAPVGDLLDEAGGVDAFFSLFQDVKNANAPDGNDGEGDGANPPAAQAGTSDGSSSSSGASV